jgi:two-component system, NarL family, response regulator DevR
MAAFQSTDPVQADPPSRHERLLIVDRNVLLADAIASAAVAAGYGDAQVVNSVDVALRLMPARVPSLVLADLELAARNDFHLLRQIQRQYAGTNVILIVDDSYNQHLAVDALVIGAAGLAHRSQGIASLLRVLDVVRGGDAAIPRHLAGLLLDTLRRRPVQQAGIVQLSARQQEVLRLVAQGLTDRDISERLHIALTTVRSHLRVIFEKTETGNRTAAALWAGIHLPDNVPPS